MDMRVVFESLRPGVQDGEEANPSSQPFRIGGHFEKGFGHRPKQNSINDPRVLKGQRSQLMRQREDDVAIRNLCARAQVRYVVLPKMLCRITEPLWNQAPSADEDHITWSQATPSLGCPNHNE